MEDLIGLEVRLARLVGDDIGTEQGELTGLPPSVEYAMPRLDIVVTHSHGIVAQIVHCRGNDVWGYSIDIVKVVGRWLTL